MAADGWNYRRAYFQDFDGKYYSVTISVAKGANGNMVYNIGNMKEEASPKVKGSSARNGNGPRGFASSETSIRSSEQKSQEKFSVAEDAGADEAADTKAAADERAPVFSFDSKFDWAYGRDGNAIYRLAGITPPGVNISIESRAARVADWRTNGQAYSKALLAVSCIL